ncbi:DUF6636 domain-containing protein [Motilibacter deserti]|uniref:Uncharacterized protein n=1 Tax=Motilibacter deserti TaxID=2714956 RepID=A0ABX0GUT9_9ACTN|nr:DUF6636 domain-containing protein [Motilibacter deserti]NHC14683.1 hypothetical protein [Motilibacter deserti]
MLRRLALGLACAAAALALPAPAAHADDMVWFQTPSRNIQCAVYSADGWQLRCDMLETTNTPPRRPRSCDFDYGHAFGLTATGKGRYLCVSDFVGDPERARTVKYGRSIRVGPFTCSSRESGLTCSNRRAHGFSLSKARQRVF